MPTLVDILQNVQTSLATLSSLQTAHAIPTIRPTTIKIPDPTPFTGKSDQVESFIREITDSITINEHAFETDAKKVLFTSRHFNGSAAPMMWYDGLRRNPTNPLLSDFDAFIDAFREHFGDPDRTATALRKLDALTQKGAASHYAAAFEELAAYTSMSDETKIYQFKKGLKKEVSYALSMRGGPPLKTFDDLAREVIRLDNSLYEHRRIHGSSNPSSSTVSNPSKSPTSTSSSNRASTTSGTPATNRTNPGTSNTAPATSRAPSNPSTSTPTSSASNPGTSTGRHITAEERQERFAKNLCLYCGKPGHRVDTCRTRLANQAKSTSNTPSGNSQGQTK